MSQPQPSSPRPAADFRCALSNFATGVVAVAALDPCGGQPIGLIANSFTSVSLAPPLVAFCVSTTSTTWRRLRRARRLTFNILAADQESLSRRLAAKGPDKFAGVGWRRSPGGAPILDGVLAWLECGVRNEHLAGDHHIVVADVHDHRVLHDGPPLTFFRSRYGEALP
jgi:3-hydroxy-9,10-secoandrosta-1,3,5(10)-triene-9,17-dione monooxygenase reductase component